MDRSQIIEEFSALSPFYFNTAFQGASPRSAIKMAENVLEKEANPYFYTYENWSSIPDELRKSYGKILGCKDFENVSLHSSVSEVISLIASQYLFKENDLVVSFEKEYPSNVLGWKLFADRRNFQFRLLPEKLLHDPKSLFAELPSETTLINFSHVGFATGNEADLEAMISEVKKRDIKLICDVTQSLGGLAIDPSILREIDVVTGAGYKWLLGPYGHAFAKWKPEFLERLPVAQGSWMHFRSTGSTSDICSYSLEKKQGASSYDRGQPANRLVHLMQKACVDLLSKVGLENISQHNQKLKDFFMSEVPPHLFERVSRKESKSSICVLKAANTEIGKKIDQALEANKIDLSKREGNYRFSFHLYNSSEQVERLLGVLKAL